MHVCVVCRLKYYFAEYIGNLSQQLSWEIEILQKYLNMKIYDVEIQFR